MKDYQKMSREFKDNLFQQFARIGKSLSSEKRLEILNLLSQGPK
ncbi:MAG TPA: ArsR family transcriptional regulator, partial [Paenibacillus sp.]|nr:ArsR family transcriptional regulator [Paenibacillus sp.]